MGAFATNYTFCRPGGLAAFLSGQGARLLGYPRWRSSPAWRICVNALAAVIGGWAMDRYIARGGWTDLSYKLLMAVARLGAIGCMGLVWRSGPRPIALGCIFLYQALCGAQSPAVFAIPQQFLLALHAAGRWVGIGKQISAVFAPRIVFAAADRIHGVQASADSSPPPHCSQPP